MRHPTLVQGAVLVAATLAAGVAAAADLPRYARPWAHPRIAYEPRGPAPALVYAPRYRVVYQVPSDACAFNDFCPAALAGTPAP